MSEVQDLEKRLGEVPHLEVSRNTPLRDHTRFGIGGPADLLVQTAEEDSFVAAMALARQQQAPYVVIGGGTNLIVSDDGFRGVVLRFRGERLIFSRRSVLVDAGVTLQTLVDQCIDHGLQGLETLTGIPGSVGAALYGNAGAYGHSIAEVVQTVRFFDGEKVRMLDREGCEFHYRESVFKKHKDWIIFSSALQLEYGNMDLLRTAADGILQVRNKKYPPTMKCAGSVFKNFLFQELPPAVRERVPERVVIEGKVPSAYFLEQVGAKGTKRGDIHVADYHANLIYNVGAGTAADLRALILDLKERVMREFGLELEEEVQYVGFPTPSPVPA